MISLYSYIWVLTDGRARRVLSNECLAIMTLDEFSAFCRALDYSSAELAAFYSGKIILFV